jgi:hypothetical protein
MANMMAVYQHTNNPSHSDSNFLGGDKNN